MTAKRIAAISLVLSLHFFCFLKSEHITTDGDLDDFQKWFQDHGGRCRCRFMKSKDRKFTAVADREIVDKESVLMVPQSLLVNSVTVERSMIGPTLEQLSLAEHQILNRPDYMERRVMHLMQVAIFVLYSIHTRDEQWLPYFKIISKHECNALWMWSEAELKELQDEKLVRKAVKWKEMISMLAANITPKLNSFGMFAGKDLVPDTLINAVCAVQSNSFNVTSNTGRPVRTLVPGLSMFTYRPNAGGTWWTKSGALRYRHVNATVQEGDTIFVDVNPTGDSIQTLLEYGVFVPEGSKFFSPLPEQNSRMRRRFVEMLKLKKKVKYSEKFTFKAAGLPNFRVQALSDKQVDDLVRAGSNPSKLSELKKIFNSPSLHVESNPMYSCKDEVVALNLLSLHLRDEMSGRTTGMPQDEDILTKDIPARLRTAVEFRLKFKRLVTNYLDITSARAIETKRECLSRKRDEL